jgi:uncharacterized protein YuzE
MFAQNLQEANNIKFTYDYDHDVLYLYFGEPTDSYEDEAAPDIYLRISDDENETITGIIILDYKKKDLNHIKKHIPISINFNIINNKIH